MLMHAIFYSGGGYVAWCFTTYVALISDKFLCIEQRYINVTIRHIPDEIWKHAENR